MRVKISVGGKAGMAALTLGALGVVFGDIGTSPLYAMSSVFQVHGVRPDATGVNGMISLVVWAIILVGSVKYVTFVLRADNRGEDGIMALVALVQRMSVKSRAGKAALILLGIFGVALFFGDGTITPAISVISSVEGLRSSAPGLKSFVVPITLALVTVLFAGQRFGTKAIGRLFGPAMVVWFAILTGSGLAARTGARHGQALGGRGTPPRLRRGGQEHGPPAASSTGDGGLPVRG